MTSRLDLHNELVGLLGRADRVYFSPPPSHVLRYPCIVYVRDQISATHADNSTYQDPIRYQVTLIDPDPDSPFVKAIKRLPYSEHVRFFTTEGLNHDIFNIYR